MDLASEARMLCGAVISYEKLRKIAIFRRVGELEALQAFVSHWRALPKQIRIETWASVYHLPGPINTVDQARQFLSSTRTKAP